LAAAGPGAATDASAERAGSWTEAWLPCRWLVEKEAIVDVEDGREMSWPIDGREGLSSNVGAVLKAGRSNACRIEGRRNVSLAWGRGSTDVASVAEAVPYQSEKRWTSLAGVLGVEGVRSEVQRCLDAGTRAKQRRRDWTGSSERW
jgi:hypothetical protein